MPDKSHASTVSTCKFKIVTEIFLLSRAMNCVAIECKHPLALLRFISIKSFHYGLLVQAANRNIGFIHLYK